ncbi:unnamed protein product [Ectocarpus sp. CCAP 1310/34]|nr:unnamed protein product [Ectocarpus sp. CCAP 1310/34]
MGTTAFIGDKAKSEARDSLENQIKRHLTIASEESATAIREWFRNLQYGVLDVTTFALRDARQEKRPSIDTLLPAKGPTFHVIRRREPQDLVLDSGNEGYPLNLAHTDLRDTEIATSAEANLQNFSRMSFEVDLSRSTWYYADAESNTVEVPEDEMTTITQTARLDLLWPTVYINSYDTKGVYVGVELSTTGRTIRYFPGTDLSGVEGSRFACEYVEEDGSIAPCFDPTVRPWYAVESGLKGPKAIYANLAVDGGVNKKTALTAPRRIAPINCENFEKPVYTQASSKEQGFEADVHKFSNDSDSTRGNLLGVVGMDVRLEQVQESVEGINFLNTGYSILATADGIVLAAGVWDRDGTEKAPEGKGRTLGDSDGDEWVDLLAEIENGGIKRFTSTSTAGVDEEWILVAAPVEGNFATATSGGAGTVTHYILSAVPRNEIFEPVVGMADLIRDSTVQIIVTTAIVACFTMVAVALSVYFLAGSITRPIVKMTSAARSIAADGAKTDVFGSVTATWGARRDSARDSARGCGTDISTPGRFTVNRTACLDYLLCRGDDEISTLGREFQLMITGLGRRGSAAEATGLMDKRTGYPKNPYAAMIVKRPPPTGPSASGGAAVPGPKS